MMQGDQRTNGVGNNDHRRRTVFNRAPADFEPIQPQPERPDTPGNLGLRNPVQPFSHLPDYTNTPRPLNSRDVCAFIVNKMVGTGIYTTPPVVLLFTRSKGEALGLWFAGFFLTIVSMIMYLEYARRLPHSGGELIYLDETIPKPRLFAYTLYSFYFILIYNTATNSMQVANQALMCASGDFDNPDPDPRALRFIAIVALSFFCLLHYFSGRAGRDLNQVLAVIKITFLIILFFAGIARASQYFEADWNRPPNTNASSSATAFLSIIFSFSGWENATFVSSEIPSPRILRRGFMAAVIIVGVMYILINMIFLLAVPYSYVESHTTQYAPLFFGNGYKAQLTWAIIITISASGSLLSVTYTCARVKQVIGKSNILPWSRIWSSSSPPRADDAGNITESPTPQGGLILHWIFAATLITLTSSFSSTSEAISFPGNLQAYAAGWVGIFIAIGFPFLFLDRDSRILRLLRLQPRRIPPPSNERWNLNDDGEIEQSSFIRKTFWIWTVIYLGCNIYIVSIPLIGPYKDGRGMELEVKGWYYIVAIACISFTALIYYLLSFGFSHVRSGGTREELIAEARNDAQGPNAGHGFSLARIVGVYPEIIEEETHHPQFGNRRTVNIIVDDENPSFFYWFFGGSQENHWRSIGVSALWDALWGRK